MKPSPFAAVLLAALLTLGGLASPAAWGQTPAQPPASAPGGLTIVVQETVRPIVAMPLQQADALIEQGKTAEAYAKLDEAQAQAGLTPFELMWVQRTRARAAQKAGDNALLLKSLDAAIATGKFPQTDLVRTLEAMVGIASRAKDHAAVIGHAKQYFEAGGNNDSVRLLRIQALAETGDNAGAIAEVNQRVSAAERGGGKAPEQELRFLGSLQRRANDPGAAATLERLAVQYPRAEYWGDLISAAARRAGENERVLIEYYRLLRASGNLKTANAHEYHADIALRQGQPAEALAVVEAGFGSGVLGSGERAAEHRKLRDAAQKAVRADAADRRPAETAARSAADGNALVDLGFASVLGAVDGSPDIAAGLGLMEQGIAKGKLRRPVAAQLHLAMAQLAAGKKPEAAATLKALQTTAAADPLADAVRLWALWSTAPALLPPRQ
jgi:hypothetical protein